MTSTNEHATNIDATAVNTIGWLSAGDTTIVVPVYQRQYRWDIGGCEQLLSDVRTVAASHEHDTHFIGSILSTDSSGSASAELVLIDGQQRITTLMLLVAALHHTVRESDPPLAAELESVLVRADTGHTKLRPHRAWAEVFERVVLDRPVDDGGIRDSRFDDNYAFFRSQIQVDEAPLIWRGLQRLEHVAITLGSQANAQQIFESLNSTGEPLRDHELIHNYVLMGLSHREQREIEDAYWVPIEQNTGESIGAFWRHYLVMATGREVAVNGEHGVYAAFRALFPRLDLPTLHAHAALWREYSEIYQRLLNPSMEVDAGIARHLGYLNTFGRGMYPLAMRALADLASGSIDRRILIDTLELAQSLLLRRTVVGLKNDRLVARLCRAREDGHDSLVRAVARITPSDERVRIGLKYSALPHPVYVLGRLADVADPTGMALEHIVPAAPADTWTGDGIRVFSDLTEDEQNSHRALAETIGNLTLLEESLAERGLDLSFPEKRELYAHSTIEATASLAAQPLWGTAAITARTASMTATFVQIWARPAVAGIDDDGLTPILDAQPRRGWPRGWDHEFEYVEYRGEHWEVYDIKYLFNRIFKRLWADSREHVVAYSERHGGPIYPAKAWNGQWDELADGVYIYMGWDSKYMLTAVQGLLDDAAIAPEVFVKYSYIAAYM